MADQDRSSSNLKSNIDVDDKIELLTDEVTDLKDVSDEIKESLSIDKDEFIIEDTENKTLEVNTFQEENEKLGKPEEMENKIEIAEEVELEEVDKSKKEDVDKTEEDEKESSTNEVKAKLAEDMQIIQATESGENILKETSQEGNFQPQHEGDANMLEQAAALEITEESNEGIAIKLQEGEDTFQDDEDKTEKRDELLEALDNTEMDATTIQVEGDQDIAGEEEVITVTSRKKDEKEEELIPIDFYYNFEELSSKATVTKESGLPENILHLQHSYGYDCKRRNNLHLLDENHVIFAAGNLIQILHLKSKEQRYLRSISGSGIGAICVHPSHKYFAVGEKGQSPSINIFEFPSMKLYRILRGGTEQSYSSLTFSPDGELLASQGGDPDFMLTLWNWKQEKTTLRTKSFSQDVFRVSFAPELEGQLTTAGTGHIRFWKMADTFTGLKLQGELGRFGRTEISDIEGYVELPDGKVLSGAEWGNLLLWEGGLIKVEITCKGRKNCHQGPIMQILLDEGELMTIGVDGYIKVWDFETIDTADVTDDSGIFEMDPMNELRVGSDVQLYCIVKSVDEENEPTIWYAQDANGGIWRLDLSFSHTSQAPEKLFTFHAGPISSCVTSPLTHLVVSTGLDSTVRVYDYIQMKQLAEAKFTLGGTAISWVPLSIDPKGGSVVVGFEDGVVRSLNIMKKSEEESLRRQDKHEAEISLKQVFKPHRGKVTAMAFDGKGEILATGSIDGTVFFLFVGDVYEPIGFIRVPGAVRQLVWTPEKFKKTAVMVVCNDGVIVEVEAPEPGNFDTTHSYEMSGLAMKTYKFKSIKSYLRHEEELERERIEEEARKKKEAEEKKKRIERGLETESENGDVDMKPKTPQKEWHPFLPKEPSQILHASYSEEGKFWLSMGDFDAGYLYECKFSSPEEQAHMMPDNIDKPLRAIPVLESGDMPIHVVHFSNNGHWAMFGMANGQIRIQQLEEPRDLSMLGPQWTLSMHDNTYGKITSIVTSLDGNIVLSSGADGNFFQYLFMSQEELDEKIKENKAKLPSARRTETQGKPVDDIDDPNAYSIEDTKQKSEYDKRMKDAEYKKKEVRKKINLMRRQFRTIIEQNESLPKHLQLSRMEFEMDREIKQELEKQTQEKIEMVKKELAWESEKLRLSLEKLRKRFKDCVECERIVVKAFTTPHQVASFRASKLSDDFYQLKAEFERKKTQLTTKDDPSFVLYNIDQTDQGKLEQGEQPKQSDMSEDSSIKVVTSLKGSVGERVINALQKIEDKKKKRAYRKSQWQDLYSSQPDDNYEDPRDVAAIKEAQENMGDYKLKTAVDYVVPDHLRMNVEKAQTRLILIKDLIHEYKFDFNVRLLALRDRKIHCIHKMKDVVDQLKEIHSKLEPSRRVAIPEIPELSIEEMPEKVFEYDQDILYKFKSDYEMKQKHVSSEGGQTSAGGFGFRFGGSSAQDKHTINVTAQSFKPVSKAGAKAEESDLNKLTGEKEEEEDLTSELEKQIQRIEQIKLEYEQNQLIKLFHNLMLKFDAELRLLRHDKFKLDVVMLDADLRQVTLFEELVLLKEYEKREDILAEKVVMKQQEKTEMQTKISELQGKIDLKKKDIEKLQEKEKNLMSTFTQSLGENNKFAEYLTKVFKKRVKRTKKKATDGADSEEDSDDESSDDSEWEESNEESESEVGGYDLDVCPPGCDQKLYDDTCTLRDKRLDIEDDFMEEKKNLDGQKKEQDGLQKKAKVIESQLKSAQDDLEAFQLEKQRKLNELIVVSTLRFHQIQYITNGILPYDLSPALVFESERLVQLQHRIKELEHEKLLQKRQMRESRKQHVQLIKDRKMFDAKISEMEEICSKMMLDKFGRAVDMEKLETLTVNRAIEELKEKLRQTELDCGEEQNKFNKEIADKKDRVTALIKDNTAKLTQLAMLIIEKNRYTQSLDNRQKKLGGDLTGPRQTDIKEKQRLIQLVQLQAQEIEALKEEIMLLSRKGGHILPPTQPPSSQKPFNTLPRI
ncbi:cilia- and flagella-associated protein 44 [Biomphalaria glabrata]|nr:cilia- and flagella-associated protein 44-like [Biomphalaria glabrata]